MRGFWKGFSQKPVGSAKRLGEGGIERNKDDLDLRPGHLQGQEGQARGPRCYRTATQVPRRRRGCGGWCGPPAGVGVTGAGALGKARSFLSLRTNSAQLYLWGWMGLALGLCQLQALLGLLGQKFRDSRRPPCGDIEGSWFADQEAEAQRG